MMTVFHTPIAAAVASITTDILDRVLVLHGFLAYLVVGLLCFGEAAVMLGFVLPGETAADAARRPSPAGGRWRSRIRGSRLDSDARQDARGSHRGLG